MRFLRWPTRISPKPASGSFIPKLPKFFGALQARFDLAVVSNFDGRLRMILEHLGVSQFFSHVFLSSELGADKPDPEIFRRALRIEQRRPAETLHVGDDPVRDWGGAACGGVGSI